MSRYRSVAAAAGIAVFLAACGSGDDATPSISDGSGPPMTTEPAQVTEATPAASATITTSPTDTADTADEDWADQVTAACTAFIDQYAGIPPHDGTSAGISAFTARVAAIDPLGSTLEGVNFPDDVTADVDRALGLLDDSGASVDTATTEAAAGDAPAAERSLSIAVDQFRRATGWLATAGAACFEADPARIAAADLTVPTELNSSQIVTAFDSVWVSQVLGDSIVRLDPTDGSVIATVEVGGSPVKAQAADGLLWVRTAADYVAVDPATDTIVRRLAKSDVGPQANRSWATDGALWICDGPQLHRYDPATLDRITTVDLTFDCGQVTAGDGLVLPWSYEENEDQSGTSTAAIIDGDTNQTLATVPMPVDVGVPVVLETDVFFPAWSGSVGVVIARTDWTVRATPDLARTTGGSLSVTDGSAIFVPTFGGLDVLVVDASTFEVVETIETQGANGVALLGGSLWVTDDAAGVTQRFDL